MNPMSSVEHGLSLNMRSGPIFIGGPDRCGKTTLRAFLVTNPNISIPAVGSNMWTYFYGQYGDLAKEKNFERCLDAMLHYKHVRFLQPDPERIRREFWQGPPTYPRLFALFQEHHAEREGKPRWGDQTGYIERYADPIFAAYPDAKMIHMVRDPRDCYEASFSKSTYWSGKAGVSTASWLQSASLARRNLIKYPGRYKIVQFEKMVSQPEEILREVCDFLGETFVPAMLWMEDVPRFRTQPDIGAGQKRSPLSTEYIGGYLKLSSPYEIAFIQKYTRDEMLVSGYKSMRTQFTTPEHIHFSLITWPINFLSMTTWRIKQSLEFGNFGPKFPSTGLAAQAGYQKPYSLN